MKNRYSFFKLLFKDYIIIINNKCYGIDKELQKIAEEEARSRE